MFVGADVPIGPRAGEDTRPYGLRGPCDMIRGHTLQRI